MSYNKEKQKEYMKRYSKNHKEELKEYAEKWRNNNKDKFKEYSKKNYQNHKKEKQEYYLKNKRNNFCIDCGKQICNVSTKCGSCAQKGHKVREESRKKMSMSWDYKKHITEKLLESVKKRRVFEKLIKRKDEIISLYKNDIPIVIITKEFKCGDRIITEILKKNNIFVKNGMSRKIFYNKEEMIRRYQEGESVDNIAKSFGISESSLCRFLKSQDMKIRPPSFYRIGKTSWNKDKVHLPLEKNPAWLGGISFEPYGVEFNDKIRKQIRKRDNYVCQECGIMEKELSQRNNNYHKKLRIHHIDYNKQNNSPYNLISLCVKCHAKTQSNRNHWTNYFKMKLFIKELFNPQNILIFNENKQLISMERYNG